MSKLEYNIGDIRFDMKETDDGILLELYDVNKGTKISVNLGHDKLFQILDYVDLILELHGED